MSHELDMAEYLFGPVTGIQGTLSRVSGLTVDSDDCADLLVSHEWGTTNIHLNSFSDGRGGLSRSTSSMATFAATCDDRP